MNVRYEDLLARGEYEWSQQQGEWQVEQEGGQVLLGAVPGH